MKIVIALLLPLFIYCQMEDCRSGSIPIGSLSKSSFSASASADQSDLPSEFNYSSADMIRAVVGSWIDKNNDTVMVCSLGADATISYNIGAENRPCGATCTRLHFQGTSSKLEPLSFLGELVFYNSSEKGDIYLNLSSRSYFLKLFPNESDSSYIMFPMDFDITELGLLKGDTLKMSP